MSDSKTIMERLQEPFPPTDIEWRVGSTTADKSKGLALAYVTNRAIQNRLDEVFGPFGWKNEFKEWKGQSQLCGISVKWEGEWITKWDGADDSNQEATKGGLSDSMKRAAYQWGIGRYLYKLPQVWVPIEPRGKSFVIKQDPKLPEWALPKGEKQDQSPRQVGNPKEPDKQKLLTVLAKWEAAGGGDAVSFYAWTTEKYQKGISDLTVADIETIDQILTKKLMEKKGA